MSDRERWERQAHQLAQVLEDRSRAIARNTERLLLHKAGTEEYRAALFSVSAGMDGLKTEAGRLAETIRALDSIPLDSASA